MIKGKFDSKEVSHFLPFSYTEDLEASIFCIFHLTILC